MKEKKPVDVELRYFSGTGNSYKIADTCRQVFVENGCRVTLSCVTDNSAINRETDLIGFCFPVYAFAIPRICRKFLLHLPEFKKKVGAFVLITAGDPKEAGFSVKESQKILNAKGVHLFYTRVIHMPANWTVMMNPPPKEAAQATIDSGIRMAKKTAQDILDGVDHHHRFNYPPAYTKWGFYKDYYLFKWLGVSNYWREFRTDDTCDGCGLCETLCPTDSIRMKNDRPKWSKTCEQCMRCVNYCPKMAIFQKSGGSVKARNRYVEPSFKPMKIKKARQG